MYKSNLSRIRINKLNQKTVIIIPTKKNWQFYLIISFLSIWLIFWLVGEVFAIGFIFYVKKNIELTTCFLPIWISVWTYGGFYAFRMWQWFLFGKEIIEITKNQMSIYFKSYLFSKSTTYDLNLISNLRIQLPEKPKISYGYRRYPNANLIDKGIVVFEYRNETIKFGNDLSEEDGLNLLDLVTKSYN